MALQASAIATVHRPTVVLAHQGGWDEIVLVVAPMVLLFGVLLLANRRARALSAARAEAAPAVEPVGGVGPERTRRPVDDDPTDAGPAEPAPGTRAPDDA